MVIDKSFCVTRKTIPNEERLKLGGRIKWLTVIDRQVVKLEGEITNLPKNHRKIGFIAVGSNPTFEGTKFREKLYSNDDTIKFLD